MERHVAHGIMELMRKWVKWLYGAWAVVTFVIVFAKGGLSADNVTHAGIIIFFFITLWIYRWRKGKPVAQPKRYFITWCVFGAAVVEGCYMITAPVFSSLRITHSMAFGLMVQKYATDLVFTIPAYLLIFYVVWRLIQKYEYSPWEYALLVGFGQAMGDGSRAFLFNPALLIFLPYVMINYHAMNVAPYLAVRDQVQSKGQKGFWKWAAPPVFIFCAYVASGLVIYTVGALFGLK